MVWEDNSMTKGLSFQQMVQGQLNVHMQKNEVGPLCPTIHKSKWIIVQYLRVKAMKLWEENVELNLYDFGLGSGSLDLISKAEISKEKLAVLSHMKIKHFCASKDTIKKMKTTHRMGEHVC